MTTKKKLLALLAVAGLATATIAAVIPAKESCAPRSECTECPECPTPCCPSPCQ